MLNLQTPLCKLLHIEYPVIQAGMAGAATADLVAAVSSAGALGTLGAAYMTPKEIRNNIRAIREHTDKPFAVNMFAVRMEDNWEGMEQAQQVLNRFRADLGIVDTAERSTAQMFEEQFQVLLDENVPVLSTAFGLLTKGHMAEAKEKGIRIIAMVTTVNEAVQAEEAGADVIVAQGSDAGGHRGTFNIREHPDGANIGTFSLVPQIADHVTVPVVAAGGIMDGRGLVAALALGASGIQAGTVFLPTEESIAHWAYKQQLLTSTEESTVITKSFSGRPARGIRNKFIVEFERFAKPLGFPSQHTLTTDIRKAAALQNNPEYMSLWAGQGIRMLQKRTNISATEIVDAMIKEAKEILE
ncbi:NAD(P)H-dependent flavin oxidoreductase [Siminovitchia sediminis]|uniref:Probable nitronate monooxygenase n=1 Tax=Siminovitchia sediminis TaxID=1274353 RepID=A0ABW4KL27_9BACI